MVKKILLIGMLASFLLIMGCISFGPTVGVSTEEVSTNEVVVEEVSTKVVSTEEISTKEVVVEEVATKDVTTKDVMTDEGSIIGTWVIEYTVEGSDIVETFLFSDDGNLTVVQAEGTASGKTYLEFTYTKTDIIVIDRSREWIMKYTLDGNTLTLEGNMLTLDSSSGSQVYTKQ